MKEGTPSQNQNEETESGIINFHDIQEERRRTLPEVLRQAPEEYKGEVKRLLDEAEEKAKQFHIKRKEDDDGPNHLDISEAKKRLRADRARSLSGRGLDMPAIFKEVPLFSDIEELAEKLYDSKNFEMTLLHKKRTDPKVKVLDSILKTVSEEKAKTTTKLEQREKDNPTVFRAYELVSYKKGLHEEGHIAHTPSVEQALDEIGRRIIVGKPMFLHGPTGTGKTSLARYAARHFTAKDPEMVYCTPQTKESNIWGKTGIRPTKEGQIETVDIFGPLAKAMDEGRIVIFDEFTALPPEQMVFIKGIMNAKTGDRVNIVGNGQIEIKPGFQIICTANLKSEKNPERASLPPEIAREFEQNNLEINYTPKDESFDIMLARLMNPDGSVDISYEDLNTTLPKFAEAMGEIQIAYTNKVSAETAQLSGAMDVSGKVPGLKKLVLTQGTVEAIMDAWMAEKQTNPKHLSFSEFLDRRLQTALTFKEYSEADRVLAAKILASKGFLRTVSAQDLGLPENIFDFDLAKKMRGEKAAKELRTKSSDEKHILLSELATVDPFNRRGQKARDVAESFLPEEERVKNKKGSKKESKKLLNEETTQFLSKIFEGWGYSQEKIDQFIRNQEAQIISPQDLDLESLKDDTNASKFGQYTLNPETKDIDWESIDKSKIEIFKLPDSYNGKSLVEITKYVQSQGKKLPGLEYYKYIIKNPDKAPAFLKDGNYHFFFGSVFRRRNGDWCVPHVRWYGSSFGPNGDWLGLSWHALCRAVLLET